MAMIPTQNRVALLKKEVTYGTDSTPAATNAILLMDSVINTTADKLERNVDQPFFGGDPFVLVGKKVELTATCDIIGAATAGTAAPLGQLYKICGHSETLTVGPPADTTYKPISTGFDSATVYFYWGGILCKMLGVRGSLDFDFSIKQYAKGSVKLTGIFSIPADAALPTGIDWSAFQTPAAVESATWDVTVGAQSVCAQSLTLASNTKVDIIECSNSFEVVISDRKPTGVLTVYKDQTLAVWNPWSVADTQAIVTLTNTITKTAGLNVTMPIRAQIEYPETVDLDGVAGYKIAFTAVPSGAGGDEYSLKFT